MKCPFCGANLSLEDEKCPYCGTPNPEGCRHQENLHPLANVFKVLAKRNFYEYNELNGKAFR